jgi:hypothetical protein
MASIYGVGIVAMCFFISELRLRSASLWVAAMAHAAHNFFFQLAIPVLIATAPGSRVELLDPRVSANGAHWLRFGVVPGNTLRERFRLSELLGRDAHTRQGLVRQPGQNVRVMFKRVAGSRAGYLSIVHRRKRSLSFGAPGERSQPPAGADRWILRDVSSRNDESP